ncbi:hypothetical protein BC829DRAFT_395049, partial [Chytridium lagenaria]
MTVAFRPTPVHAGMRDMGYLDLEGARMGDVVNAAWESKNYLPPAIPFSVLISLSNLAVVTAPQSSPSSNPTPHILEFQSSLMFSSNRWVKRY